MRRVFVFLVGREDYRIESRRVVSLVIVDVESVDIVDIVDVVSTAVVDEFVVSVFVLEQAVVSAISDSIRKANLAMFVYSFERLR